MLTAFLQVQGIAKRVLLQLKISWCGFSLFFHFLCEGELSFFQEAIIFSLCIHVLTHLQVFMFHFNLSPPSCYYIPGILCLFSSEVQGIKVPRRSDRESNCRPPNRESNCRPPVRESFADACFRNKHLSFCYWGQLKQKKTTQGKGWTRSCFYC